MNRGDVYWCDFEPSHDHEIKKLRPAVIISNDMSNKYIGVVQVVPLTSNISNIYPAECLIKTSEKSAKSLGSQITTVDKARLKKLMSKVTAKEMKDLEKIIKLQLGLK